MRICRERGRSGRVRIPADHSSLCELRRASRTAGMPSLPWQMECFGRVEFHLDRKFEETNDDHE